MRQLFWTSEAVQDRDDIYDYIVVYDVAGDSVRILRVIHAALQWPPTEGGLS